MKIWVDDVREAPEGYHWCKSVNEAIFFIQKCESNVEHLENLGYRGFLQGNRIGRMKAYKHAKSWEIELIDIDHDAGDFVSDGGDYIKILDWLEETGRNYPIRIHSMNPVGVQNMRVIIQKNGWKEIR